ncbi:nucleotidyltransferase family protein [Selenomonas massiliensis]|uniref:nucleotidyltransferase family protein n=1 Tax=Selenomonas massiliensis TaxID=2058293 RepID=UPI000D10773C|nr:nucleotidyltransferase domain-containing protein [Selenomonas massiliensis]
MMQKPVFTMEHIVAKVKPLANKYRVKEIYLFGSYARGEADENSDLDFLVYGGEKFKRTMIFALAEDLRETLEKKVDVFEIGEVNPDSNFYKTIMKEKVLVA